MSLWPIDGEISRWSKSPKKSLTIFLARGSPLRSGIENSLVSRRTSSLLFYVSCGALYRKEALRSLNHLNRHKSDLIFGFEPALNSGTRDCETLQLRRNSATEMLTSFVDFLSRKISDAYGSSDAQDEHKYYSEKKSTRELAPSLRPSNRPDR